MQEDVVALLVGGAGVGRNGRGIELAPHRETNIKALSKLGHGLDRVDGTADDFDADVLEWQAVCCEVNQLLTAIWSPIASVEKHRCPMTGNRCNHVASFAIVADACNRRKFRTVLKDMHRRDSSSHRPLVAEAYVRGDSPTLATV